VSVQLMPAAAVGVEAVVWVGAEVDAVSQPTNSMEVTHAAT
jgi:hypothetical protein